MKSLKEIQKIFTWYYICPVANDASKLSKYLRIISIVIFYLMTFPTILNSAAYLWKFYSSDMAKALYGFFQGAVLVYVMYAITVGLTIRKDIQRIFIEFQQCYEFSKFNFCFES